MVLWYSSSDSPPDESDGCFVYFFWVCCSWSSTFFSSSFTLFWRSVTFFCTSSIFVCTSSTFFFRSSWPVSTFFWRSSTFFIRSSWPASTSCSLPAWLADLWTPLSSGGPQPSSSPPVWLADLWPRPSSSPPGGPGRKPDRILLLRPVALAQSLPPPTPDPSSFFASSSPLSFRLLCPFLL